MHFLHHNCDVLGKNHQVVETSSHKHHRSTFDRRPPVCGVQKFFKLNYEVYE